MVGWRGVRRATKIYNNVGGRCPRDHKTGEKMQNEEDKKEMLEISEREGIETGQRHLVKWKYNVICLWLIMGAVFTPAFTASSFIMFGVAAFFIILLIGYVVALFLTAATLSALKKAEKKSDVIGYGIASMILVSFIGGLLILLIGEKDFIGSPKEEYLMVVDNSMKRVIKRKKVDEAERTAVLDKLKGLAAEAKELDKVEKLDALKIRLKEVMKEFYSERNKKARKIAFIVGIILVVAASATVITVVAVNAKGNNDKRKKEYDELYSMVYNYDKSNYTKISLYLSSDLKKYYDLTEIEKEFNNISTYTGMLNYMKDPERRDLDFYDMVEGMVNKIDAGYKDSDLIRKEVGIAKEYANEIKALTHGIKYNGTSINVDSISDLNSETADRVRELIGLLGSEANESGHWNHSNFIGAVNIPYILYNAGFEVSAYDFKWQIESDDLEKETVICNLPNTKGVKQEDYHYSGCSFDFRNNRMIFYFNSNDPDSNEYYTVYVYDAFYAVNNESVGVKIQMSIKDAGIELNYYLK